MYAGTPPLKALSAIVSIAASHSPEFSLMRVDVSRAYFPAKAQVGAGETARRRMFRKGRRKIRTAEKV